MSSGHVTGAAEQYQGSECRRIVHALPDRIKPRLGSQSNASQPPEAPASEAPATATSETQRAARAAPNAPKESPTMTNRAIAAMVPPTAEEVQEEFALLTEQLRQLRSIQQRGRYIAQREVQNMRRAYDFALSREKELFAETHSTNGAAAPGATGTPYERSAAATAADVELVALEAYVTAPLSSTYENKARGFSWQSVVHTPGERRMQSVMVFCLLFFTGIPISWSLIAFLIYIHPITAALAILYVILIFTKWTPVFPVQKDMSVVRHRVFHWYRDYFPVRLVVPAPTRAKFDKMKNYFFVYHPHGIHGFGAIMCFGLDVNDTSKMLPGIRTHLQTLRVNFFIPFWRRLMLWTGSGDASAACLRQTLRAGPGESVVLVVGGAAESLKAKPNTNNLFLKGRKGFIKIALQEGSPLVPVYGFGENNAYNVPAIASRPTVQKLLRFFQKMTGFAVPLLIGRGFFFFNIGLMPYRRPIVVVVGDPVEVPKIEVPTDADIALWHDKYVEALEHLYMTHRDVYDLESTGLRIM